MSERPALGGIVKLLLPQTPLLLKTAIWHSIGLSPESSKWDLKTAMIITTIRGILSRSTSSITRQQSLSMRDPGKKGPMWIAPTTLPVAANDNSILDVFFGATDDLKSSPDEIYTEAAIQPVEAEWTGYRPNVSDSAPPPPDDQTPTQLYNSILADTHSDAVILYFHGGAHYLMDPATHRTTVAALCKHAGGARALNVRYRLAPQNPFPAGILDCLVAYLSLLYPAPDALHKTVKPENILFAGDSAGGNCCLSLLALLLHLQRQSEKGDGMKEITFNGQTIHLPLPLPSAVATNSAWCDFTRSSPSLHTNAHYDYIPAPSFSLTATPAVTAPTGLPTPQPPAFPIFTHNQVGTRLHQPGETRNPFPCAAWPAVPPRADLYTHGSMLSHPLVSPLALPAEAWTGAPPMFFEVGEEMLSDEVDCVARRCKNAGVKVRWVGFEAMPHCFAQLLSGAGAAIETAEMGMGLWGRWIGAVAGGDGKGAGDVQMEGGTWFEAQTLKESEVDIAGLAPHLSDEECWGRMREEQRRRCEAFARLVEREGGVSGENGVAKL